jgi:hypothetical protein
MNEIPNPIDETLELLNYEIACKTGNKKVNPLSTFYPYCVCIAIKSQSHFLTSKKRCSLRLTGLLKTENKLHFF